MILTVSGINITRQGITVYIYQHNWVNQIMKQTNIATNQLDRDLKLDPNIPNCIWVFPTPVQDVPLSGMLLEDSGAIKVW